MPFVLTTRYMVLATLSMTGDLIIFVEVLTGVQIAPMQGRRFIWVRSSKDKKVLVKVSPSVQNTRLILSEGRLLFRTLVLEVLLI